MANNLLVVDDEPDVLEVFKDVFKKEGYTVFTAGDSEEALKVLEESSCDVLITDICLPGEDGIGLIKQTKRRWPKMPMIAMTGYGSDKVLLDCINADCFGYVDKPFDWEYMKLLVKKALS